MPVRCKGKCRFERNANRWTYRDGLKMCTTCEKGIDTKHIRCYCCSSKFRIGAQVNIYRQVRTANVVRF
jgi:hypothetical protein